MRRRGLTFPLLAATLWVVAASALGFQEETISFSKARIIIELNASAEDVRVQVLDVT